MKPIVLIPCRMASTRLPDKPLADIAGKPMILRVWEKAVQADVGPVVVACDDERVKSVIDSVGGNCVLTDPDLPSGSDRIWQGLQHFDPKGEYDVIINLQGDLPNVSVAALRDLLVPLKDDKCDISTLGVPFDKDTDRADPNQVKIVFSAPQGEKLGRALYFTRADVSQGYYHVGLYGYRREALERFINLPVSPLEQAEKLEQLRALEDGMRIGVYIVEDKPIGVDTPEDLENVQNLLIESKQES